MRSRSALPVLLLCLSLPLGAQPPEPISSKITNGVLDNLHPSVGLFDNDGECSATLIGCSTVLTAAHCICETPSGHDFDGVPCQARQDLVGPDGKLVFFQHAGLFTLSSIAVSPAYRFRSGVSDLAILHLSTPVTNVAPSPLNRVSLPPLGLRGEIVGFGSTRTNSTDDGLKRRGAVTTAACDPPASGFVCWNFRKPIGPPGVSSDTCFGDSGGPLFLTLGGQTVLAGVTSSGTNDECAPVDNSFDADVFANLAWIVAEGGADLDAAACGTGPQIGGAGTSVQASVVSLRRGPRQAASTVEVPAGTAELRVALNSADWFFNGNALYVRHGAPASPAAFDCKGDEASGQQFCSVRNPAPGTWHVLARHLYGPGSTVQIVASLIATSP